MWIAHLAIGLAVKAIAPSVDLGWLMFYGALEDFLIFTIGYPLGLESFGLNKELEAKGEGVPIDWHVPFSHSLFGTLALMALATILSANNVLKSAQRARQAIANRPMWDSEALGASLCIFSHFLLELPVHRKDIRVSLSPFPSPTDTYWGAGLFARIHLSFFMELAILAGSCYLYMKSTKPKPGSGTTSDKSLMLFFGALLFEHIRFYYGPTSILHLPRLVLAPTFAAIILGFSYYGHLIDQGRETTIKPGIRFSPTKYRVTG